MQIVVQKELVLLDEEVTAVKFYPNPNTGQFQILVQNLSAGRLNGRLFNAAGQLVGETDWLITQAQAELSWQTLPQLPAGLYLLQLWDAEGKHYSQQMIIQN